MLTYGRLRIAVPNLLYTRQKKKPFTPRSHPPPLRPPRASPIREDSESHNQKSILMSSPLHIGLLITGFKCLNNLEFALLRKQPVAGHQRLICDAVTKVP